MSEAIERHVQMSTNCGACWSSVQLKDMASMTDRNGHRWYICPECIDALWKLRQPNPDGSAKPDNDSVRLALATLVGFVNGLYDVVNPLSEVSQTIKDAMLTAMDDARRFYSDDTN